ncbi:MAG: M48 family peptidase [Betaproteobacteria bacterium]|nr:M48 family peptidase [Betaproteobacteria bacterium]NBT75394.1 M48 family peptidase [Betaproteobacteria bacterium]NBY14339.1 M48 family peptidase [Betaproteobacteria bacterium]NCA15954.1 M48 family peptidase [Betaproteobacteria bacterium]
MFRSIVMHMRATPFLVALCTTLSLAGCVTGQTSNRLSGPGDGVVVGESSELRRLVPAAQLERSAAQQYESLKKQASRKNALLPESDPQVQRLLLIAQRLRPFAEKWNPDAARWRWEVIVLRSDQVNAFCMPGGKIAFYTGILEKLKLSDDEAAMVMGHEMAHALREHARDRMAKGQLTDLGATILSSALGLGEAGRQALGYGSQLLTLKFSRDDETEADLVGMDIAARAGFDPRTGISLWRKMQASSKGAPPEWLSTHPAGSSRIDEISRNLPRVMPLYASAIGRTLETVPPDPSIH